MGRSLRGGTAVDHCRRLHRRCHHISMQLPLYLCQLRFLLGHGLLLVQGLQHLQEQSECHQVSEGQTERQDPILPGKVEFCYGPNVAEWAANDGNAT